MGWKFNPPPGWSVPPDGWVPPPGWTPDPAWPPATITHRGSSNFQVTALDSEGQPQDLLVNEIGNYSGVLPLDFDATPVALKIEADGTWKIDIKVLAKAPVWPGKSSGTGAAVLQVPAGEASGLTVVKITHVGASNFTVMTYTDSDKDLLVNEIGRYTGETNLPDGTRVIVVNADGAWTITKA